MDYYLFIRLRHKVPTRRHKLGMDTTVCRAESREVAIAQLLPEMRDCVEYVSQRWAMRDYYPNPKGILRGDVIWGIEEKGFGDEHERTAPGGSRIMPGLRGGVYRWAGGPV